MNISVVARKTLCPPFYILEYTLVYFLSLCLGSDTTAIHRLTAAMRMRRDRHDCSHYPNSLPRCPTWTANWGLQSLDCQFCNPETCPFAQQGNLWIARLSWTLIASIGDESIGSQSLRIHVVAGNRWSAVKSEPAVWLISAPYILWGRSMLPL